MRADHDRVLQVLINLVDNAVKYTPAGGSVTVQGRRAEDGRVVLAVSDTGIGIPRADLPRITERFYRVDKARSRELGGTGLGLAIVKHLVLAHGGDLAIESERRMTTMLYSRRYQLEGLTAWLEQLEFSVERIVRIEDSKRRPRVAHVLARRR